MTDTGALREKRHWQKATVAAIEQRTPRIKSFFFDWAGARGFVAGQHVDLRLVAEDGYEARRSYSIASAPESFDHMELAIERLEDGEVSTFFHEVVQPGDEIELRGPLGGHFVWSVEDRGPVLLVGGGSGVVPLMSMIRHHAAQGSEIPLALVTSARTAGDLLYLDELRALHANGATFRLHATVSRENDVPADLGRGRIGPALLEGTLASLGAPLHVFVCGSNPFVESVTRQLLGLGLPAARIRTERYGG